MKSKYSHLPKHVAFIMDGNRRWAKDHNLPVFEGHRLGERRVEPLIDEALTLGIAHLTFWAFSTDNWNRTKQEVGYLLNLFRTVLDGRVNAFHKKNVKLHIIGDAGRFPNDIRSKIRSWEEKTGKNTGITVNIALSYGGRDEIIRAIGKMNQESGIRNQEITAETFQQYLDTAGQPDPDLIIRTGGEQRLSGFLLWQSEYAELYFTEVLWPDFTVIEFHRALTEYANRQRRFGT